MEKDFRPAQKAHPALRCRDYAACIAQLSAAGVNVPQVDDIPGVRRCHIHDPKFLEIASNSWVHLTDPAMLVRSLRGSAVATELLLCNAGISFVAYPTNIPEQPQPGEGPRDYAERLAREKALAAFNQRSDSLVLGADTIVIVDGEILGKPRDAADAKRMLRLLSGR